MAAAVPRVDTVVEFDGLVPVVAVGRSGKAVIAGGAGGKLAISTRAFSQIYSQRGEFLSRDIVEIVLRVKEHSGVIVFAQILHTCRLGVALILACYMVGHEVDDNFQTCLVGARHQCLKLSHALFHIDCKVGTHVIVVTDGVW